MPASRSIRPFLRALTAVVSASVVVVTAPAVASDAVAEVPLPAAAPPAAPSTPRATADQGPRVPGAVSAALSNDWLGDRSSFTMLRRSLSDRSELAVNAATGNVLLTATDLDVAGVGQRLTIRRYFNSSLNVGRTLPTGWTLGVSSDIRLTFGVVNGIAPVIDYAAPDGSRYQFARQSDGSYASPAGLDATLTTSDLITLKLRFNKTGVTMVSTPAAIVAGVTKEAFVKESVDRDGNKQQFTYAVPAGGSTQKKLTAITDSQGRSYTFTYDDGQTAELLSFRDVAGNRAVSFGYDFAAPGHPLMSVRDTAGKTTTYGYAGGNLSSVTTPDGGGTTIAYGDAADPDRVTSVTYGAGSPVAGADVYSYPDTATVKVRDPNGNTTTYTHDGRARITKVVDPLGRSRTTTYTTADQPATLTDDSISAVTRLTYDARNNVTKIQSPDVAGGGAGSGRAVQLGYPAPTGSLADYQPTSSTDAQGNRTSYGYNAAGRLTTVGTPGAAGGTPVNRYQGDAGITCGGKPGELCSVTDGLGRVTAYGYDPSGNLTSITPPAPLGATAVVPDAVGRSASVTDGRGQQTSFSYDGLDRPTEIRYAGATTCTPSAGTCIRYGYDGQGNVVSRTDNTGTTTWAYDAQNRVTTKTLPGSVVSSIGYDPAGAVISFTDPGGTVGYRYNPAGDLVALWEPGGSCPATPVAPNATRCTSFGYDTGGRRNRVTYPSGQANTLAYDTGGRLTSVVAKNGATTLRSYSYTYTFAGKDSALVQTVNADGTVSTYTYDPLNRLTKQVAGATTRTWTYDKAGNRLTSTETGSPSRWYAYNAADQLCWTATTSGSACGGPPGGAVTYAHDGEGNRTRVGTTNSAYNGKNQTTAIGGTTFAYADADSTERTSATGVSYVNGLLGVTRQTGSGSGLSFTREPDGTLVSMRVDRAGGGYDSNYYTLDAQGSVLQLNDQSVATTASYCYDPYGATGCTTGGLAGTNPFRYVSGQADGTGLTKFGTRYYDSSVGGWTQGDPVTGSIADPGSTNRYLYAADDPVNHVDPSGRNAVCSGTFLVAGLSADTIFFLAAEFGLISGGFGFLAGVAFSVLYFAVEQAVCN